MDRLSTLVLLSEKKTTSSSSETFDAWLFKRCVNKDDVSLAVIKKLQEEFGTDISGGEWNKIWTICYRPSRPPVC